MIALFHFPYEETGSEKLINWPNILEPMDGRRFEQGMFDSTYLLHCIVKENTKKREAAGTREPTSHKSFLEPPPSNIDLETASLPSLSVYL